MQTPLVTIGILTYNSSDFIYDALNSVKDQLYPNIELIISDDGSSDDTVDKVSKWVDIHSKSFVNCEVLTVDKNTGVSANCNRILSKARGLWLKFLAGDDALCPDCIREYMAFAALNPQVQWISSFIQPYKDFFNQQCELCYYKDFYWNLDTDIYERSANDQLNKIIFGNYISAPASIYRVEILKNVGGYDEKYNILEDFPMFIKLLEAGVKCFFCEKILVKQRVGSTNLCSNTQRIFNIKLRRIDFIVTRDFCFKYYNFTDKLFYILTHLNMELFDVCRLNRNNRFCVSLYNFMNKVVRVISMRFNLCNYDKI